MPSLVKSQLDPKLLLFFFVIPLAFGYSIATQNYNVLLAVAILFLGALLFRSNLVPIFIILFMVFFGNWLEALGFLPAQFNWGIELIIIIMLFKALMLKVIRREKFNAQFLGIILFFFGFSLVSYLINNLSIFHVILFFRLLFRYYLFFLALINLDLDMRSMKLINWTLMVLFIIQIPTAVVKMFYYGQGESAIGTYAVHKGEYSTIIPMIAIGYLVALYFFYKPSKWYFLLAIGFIAFGIIGGKKAIFFFIPILIAFLSYYLRDYVQNFFKIAVIGLLIAVMTIIVSARMIPVLNPQGRTGGDLDFNYLMRYFTDYAMRSDIEGHTEGRAATFLNIYNILKNKGFDKLIFGLGPGSYIQTRIASLKTTLRERRSLAISYGATGLSWLALQLGYPGALIYLFLFYFFARRSFQFFKTEERPYWKSFGFGLFSFSFIMLFISFFYHPVFYEDLIPAVFFLLTALMISSENQLKAESREVESYSG